ncbi:Spore coat polysaccharide biosynthesis protein SpsA [compost metagenome]
MGLETAATRGIPVGVVGSPTYRGWGFTLDLEDREGYPALLERLVQTPPSEAIRRRAFRAVYRLFFGLSIPFSKVKVVNFSRGQLTYESPAELAPGLDADLDRIADGLMGRAPLYPPPEPGELARTTADEDAFLAAHPSVAPQEQKLPTVSVVAYIHNYAHYLEAALTSILEQTYTDFELYILDDGSTDNTAQVIEPFLADPRVRYEYQPNKGRDRLHETFNRCLEATTGELIVIANGDDLMHPEKIERQVMAFLSDPEIEIVYHDATFIDAQDREIPGGFSGALEARSYRDRLLGRLKFVGCFIPNPSVMFRRDILRRIGLQEDGWMHDYQFWLKAAMARCRFHRLPDRLLRYRIHEESHSTSSHRINRILDENRRMRRYMRERYTIEDLFPELAHCQDGHAARVSAYLHMGFLFASGAHPLFDMAMGEFRSALALDPASVEARNNLAVALLKTGESDEALGLLRELTSQHPIAARNLETALGRPDPASAEYQLLQQDPDQTELFLVRWESEGDPRDEVIQGTILAAVEADTDPAALQAALTAYLQAFTHEDPAALVLLTTDDAQTTRIAEGYEAAVLALGLPEEQLPTLAIQQVRPAELQSVFLGQLLGAAAFLALPGGDVVAELSHLAAERGREVIATPAVATLQAAGSRTRIVPAPVPLRLTSPLSLLALPDWSRPEAWQGLVRAFAQTFREDEPVSLRLWLAPGGPVDLAGGYAQVAACLQAAGIDADSVADLVLFDDLPSTADLRDLFAGIDAFVSDGEPIRKALALAHGARVVSALELGRLKAQSSAEPAAATP